MLIPTAVVGGNALAFLPVSASAFGSSPLPGAGDVLRALVGNGGDDSEDFGATGRMPEADTISPELLAALTGPAAQTATGAGPLATVPPGPLGIPGIVLDAYMRAEQTMATSTPGCGVSWPVLAAIGRVESNHARGGRVDVNGTTISPILGPQLSGGPGVAAISDSDDGRLDGDRAWDRAVGPMQFIPTTWARYAIDGNDDGLADPHNIYDATLAAAHYLCASGEDLRDPAALARSIFRYNHSDSYVRTVLAWAAAYAAGVTPLPSTPAAPDQPAGPPTTPPGPPTSPSPPGPTPTTSPPTTSTSTSTSSSTSTSTSTTSTTTEQPTTTTTEPPTSTTSPETTSRDSDTSTPCATPTTTTTEPPPTTTPTEPGCPAEAPTSENEQPDGAMTGTPTSSMRPV